MFYKSKSKSHKKLSWKEYASLFLIILFGEVISLGSTIFYLAFYRGWWLVFIIILMGITQLLYLSIITIHLNESNNSYYKSIIRSILFPFFIAIMLNAIMTFFFFNESFRIYLGHHLQEHNNDAPSFETFLLCIIYFIAVGYGCIICLRIDFHNYIPKSLNLKITIKTSISILLCYLILFFYPNISTSFYDYHIYQEQQHLEKEYRDQILNNRDLQLLRKNEITDLSFKGIIIGAPYETNIQTAEAISDFQNRKENYYTIKSKCNEEFYDFSSYIEEHWQHPSTFGIQGHYYSGYTTFQNYLIKLNIYEFNNIVPLIIIDFYMNEEDFYHIVKLYSSKYGEPERMTPSGLPFKEDPQWSYILKNAKDKDKYYGNYENKIKNDYVWTYKNGIVRLSTRQIMYISNNFIEVIKNENKNLNSKGKQS